MTREFRPIWGDGYPPNAHPPVSFDFFCEDRGYSRAERARIDALAVGARLDLNDPVTGAQHSVTRLPDANPDDPELCDGSRGALCSSQDPNECDRQRNCPAFIKEATDGTHEA